MKPGPAIALGAAVLVAAGLVGVMVRGEGIAGPAWQEIAWPYPLDPWPAGRAFSCATARCEVAVQIALRPKIGFCNCATGVADDDEIDRVGDTVLVGDRYAPDGPGRPLRIGGLAGRSRHYRVEAGGGRKISVVGFAVAAHCDVVVGIIESPTPLPAATEDAAFRFLGEEPLRAWAEASVGGT
jgi:hypothetical protein